MRQGNFSFVEQLRYELTSVKLERWLKQLPDTNRCFDTRQGDTKAHLKPLCLYLIGHLRPSAPYHITVENAYIEGFETLGRERVQIFEEHREWVAHFIIGCRSALNRYGYLTPKICLDVLYEVREMKGMTTACKE